MTRGMEEAQKSVLMAPMMVDLDLQLSIPETFEQRESRLTLWRYSAKLQRHV